MISEVSSNLNDSVILSCVLWQHHGSPDLMETRSTPSASQGWRVWAYFSSSALPSGYWRRAWTRHLIINVYSL